MRTDPTLERPAISAAGRYDALHADRTSDVAFYAREAAAAGGPVLEVGCGTGRVSLAIAAAGVRITGLDRDPALLSGAAAIASDTRPVPHPTSRTGPPAAAASRA